MRFLKIKDGVCINVERVEALEIIDQLHTRVYMTNGVAYESMFPYETLVTLLEIKEEKPESDVDTEILKKLNTMAENSQSFAG
jgi:hypothetical protein